MKGTLTFSVLFATLLFFVAFLSTTFTPVVEAVEGKECYFYAENFLTDDNRVELIAEPAWECWADYARPEWIDMHYIIVSAEDIDGLTEHTQLTKERKVRAKSKDGDHREYITSRFPQIEELKKDFRVGFENQYLFIKTTGLSSYGGMRPTLFFCGEGCLTYLDDNSRYSHVYKPKRKRGGGFRIISNRGEGSAVRSHVTPLKEPVLGIVGGVAPMW